MTADHWHTCPGGLEDARGFHIRTHPYRHRSGECRAISKRWCGCGANWRNNDMKPYIRGRGL